MKPEISHNKNNCRFETVVDGYTAYVEYVIADNTIDIIHTIVPREIGGKGIAAALVEAATGMEIVKDCNGKLLARMPQHG